MGRKRKEEEEESPKLKLAGDTLARVPRDIDRWQRVDNFLTEHLELCELLRPELSTAIGVQLSKADSREEAFQATKFIQR